MKYLDLCFKRKQEYALEVYDLMDYEYSAGMNGMPQSFWTKRIEKTIDNYALSVEYEEVNLRSIFDILYKNNNKFSRTHFVNDKGKKVFLYEIENTHANVSRYIVSEKEFQEFWDKSYMIECDEDDEYLTLEVEGFRNKNDKPTEYSIKYTCMDNDNTGTINNINTSSVFALRSLDWEDTDFCCEMGNCS